MDFAVHADRLDAEADTRLGDLIQYAVNGADGGAYVPMKARIYATERERFGAGPTDEMRGGWRLRIRKALVENPSKNDRLECAPILGEGCIYRPVAKDPISDGRYWLVDIQKV